MLVLGLSVWNEILGRRLAEKSHLKQGEHWLGEVLATNVPAWPPSCLHPPSQDSSPGVLLGEGKALHTHFANADSGPHFTDEETQVQTGPHSWEKQAWGLRVISSRTGTRAQLSWFPGNWSSCLSPLTPLPSVSRPYLRLWRIMAKSCFHPSLPFKDSLPTHLYHFHYSSLNLRVKSAPLYLCCVLTKPISFHPPGKKQLRHWRRWVNSAFKCASCFPQCLFLSTYLKLTMLPTKVNTAIMLLPRQSKRNLESSLG